MMTKEEILAAWSPEMSPWSPWAKTVLFAHLYSPLLPVPRTSLLPDVSWAPAPGEKAAMVIDLPGAEGVWAGVALAAQGYCPVPLYNALPLPAGQPVLDPLSNRKVAAVDILPILEALRQGAEILAQLKLPLDAPPVFLLDSNRYGDGRKMQPDEFDNRSICFTTDFPSANFLLTQGFRRVLLVQPDNWEPKADLIHVLRRWQDGDLMLERMFPDKGTKPQPFKVPRPSWYGSMFQRALSSLGLRRGESGGFGAWMPESGSGG